MYGKQNRIFLVTILACLGANFVIGDESATATEKSKPVTESCLYCICEALSGCNATAICVNGACGIFRITWGYWVEAGQPTFENETVLHDNAFTNCVNDPFCAAETVQRYMTKYGQDCNGDNKIDCLDFGALHKMGNLNCASDMPFNFGKPFNKCLKRFKKEALKAEREKDVAN